MFGLAMLDVLIGLITVYLACGLACTAFVEAVTAWFGVRSRNLEDALREFMAGNLSDNKKFIDAFFDHPLVQSLSKGQDGRPSYIPKETVAQVIQSLVLAGNSASKLKASIDEMPDLPGQNRIKVILASCAKEAAANADDFRKMVELHFDASMQRASGWFKRYAQNVTIAISMTLVFGANIDSLEIASSLSTSPEVRLQLVAIASAQLDDAKKNEAAANQNAIEKSKQAAVALEAARENLSANALTFGWEDRSTPDTIPGWLKKLAGLLMSGFAISLGAPFWFDVLKMFMNVRTSVAVFPPPSPAEK